MECPTCHHSDRVEIDTHADGFAANLNECGLCGTMWTVHDNICTLVHGATRELEGLHAPKECPICHSTNQVEIDIHADGYANNLGECGACGALWCMEKDSARLIHGATWAF